MCPGCDLVVERRVSRELRCRLNHVQCKYFPRDASYKFTVAPKLLNMKLVNLKVLLDTVGSSAYRSIISFFANMKWVLCWFRKSNDSDRFPVCNEHWENPLCLDRKFQQKNGTWQCILSRSEKHNIFFTYFQGLVVLAAQMSTWRPNNWRPTN